MADNQINFTPTRRVEDFTPAGPVRAPDQFPGGPPPTEQLIAEPTPGPPRFYPTPEGPPPPSESPMAEAVPTIARYGPPILATLMLGPAAGAATIAGGAAIGEFTAREYEDYFNQRTSHDLSEKLRRHAENVGSAITAGGMSYISQRSINALLSRVSGGVPEVFKTRGPLQRKLIPEELPRDIRTAQATLRGISPKDRPLSLPLDVINREEQNWITFLGATARSGIFGRKRMAKAHEVPLQMLGANVKQMTGMVDDYLTWQSRVQRPRDFGRLLKGILTKEIDFVESIRKGLYTQYDEIIAQSTETVDAHRLFQYFQKNIQRSHVRKVYREMSDLLPKLGSKAAPAWDKLNLKNTDEVIKRVNRLWKRSSDAERATLSHIQKQVEPALESALGRVPGAVKARATASTFFAAKQDRLYNAITQKVRDKLEASPRSVLSMFKDSKDRLSTYLNMKTAFTRGTPTRIEGRITQGTVLDEKTFNATIRKPLQHSLIAQSADPKTGVITGKSLSRVLNKDPDFISEVFGKDAAANLRDYATSMQVLETQRFGDKVFIQLVQGGALTALAGAALTGQDQPLIKKIGAGTFVIFAGPSVVSRMMTNPRFIQSLTTATSAASARSIQVARLLTTIDQQTRASRFDFREMANEAKEFYSSWQGLGIDEPEQQAQPPEQGQE